MLFLDLDRALIGLIVVWVLQGLVNRMSGEANIDFISKFYFTVGSLYAAAPLIVKANLTTDMDEGQLFSAQGKKLENGRGRWADPDFDIVCFFSSPDFELQ